MSQRQAIEFHHLLEDYAVVSAQVYEKAILEDPKAADLPCFKGDPTELDTE